MTKFIQFDTLQISDLATELDRQITNTKNAVANLVKVERATWESVIAPLQKELYNLNQAWGIIGHLQSVKDSPEIRDLHDKYLPIITELYVGLGQNKSLYKLVQSIHDTELNKLNQEQQKVIANELRDFLLSGISLSDEKQAEFKALQNQLSQLSTKFDHNVLDATDIYARYATLPELSGVPEDSLQMYKAMAEADGRDDYKVTLHMPCYLPIMQYADNRALREELYQAYVTRASELSYDGKFDNASVIAEILRLRRDKAKLLGFNNYAELSLYNKMADNHEQVVDFLMQLAKRARSFAQQDLAELGEFAKTQDDIDTLEAWDIPYYSEKLQQHKYSYSSNELKQYFQLPKVLNGLYGLIKTLFNVEFVANKTMPVWHESVSGHDVLRDGVVIGHIYFDLYARDGKQPGAWMNSAQDRSVDNNETRLPIAYIICNFTAPVGNKPSLLTFDDTQTLFHEMGHGLHHLLTVVANSSISGINGVEWDAVELPSQFMEYFAWDYAILQTITAHADTGAVLPYELFEKVLASRHYQSGLMTLRQIEFAVFDMHLHSDFDVLNDNYLVALDTIRKQISVVIPPSYNRFANTFGHIFAGGYAAGYYSYKWAEVLACDVFAMFEGKSGIELQALGQKYLQSILSQGGIRPMMENFMAFMGREPELDALLKSSGLND